MIYAIRIKLLLLKGEQCAFLWIENPHHSDEQGIEMQNNKIEELCGITSKPILLIIFENFDYDGGQYRKLISCIKDLSIPSYMDEHGEHIMYL